jgi:hypothetical protein
MLLTFFLVPVILAILLLVFSYANKDFVALRVIGSIILILLGVMVAATGLYYETNITSIADDGTGFVVTKQVQTEDWLNTFITIVSILLGIMFIVLSLTNAKNSRDEFKGGTEFN